MKAGLAGNLNKNDLWTGHINPDKVNCANSAGCQDQVNLASNGAHYNTSVYPDHKVKYDNGGFCGRFQHNFGINELNCNNNIRYSCEFLSARSSIADLGLAFWSSSSSCDTFLIFNKCLT